MEECLFLRLQRYLTSFIILIYLPVANGAFSEELDCLDDSCYFLDNTAKTWDEAATFCDQQKGHLVHIVDKFEQTFLENRLHSQKGNYWIGLNDINRTGFYHWTDNTTVTFAKWNLLQPVIGLDQLPETAEKFCVTMMTGLFAGLWNVTNCSDAYFSICEVNQKDVNINATSGLCESSWSNFENFCYKYYVNSLTWFDAQKFCETNGGNLATIHSIKEEQFIASISNHGFWIGLDKLNTSEGHHIWVDGSLVTYTSWNQGEPNNLNKLEDCVLAETVFDRKINERKVLWSDKNCYLQNSFMCKINLGVVPASDDIAFSDVTETKLQTCNNTKWKLYNNSCYYTEHYWKTWMKARAHCRELSGELVSIGSREELEFIFKLLDNTYPIKLWIGLNKLNTKKFVWSDEKPVSFINWEMNEPNDVFYGEKCVAISSDAGTWVDLNCGVNAEYICKKDISNTNPLPPIKEPEGECPTNWHISDRYCYKMFSQPEHQKNWNDALNFCRSMGPYHDLVSIDEIEQDYLITLLQSYQVRSWIGKAYNSDYQWDLWTDNSDTSFMNWDYGEPKKKIFRRFGDYPISKPVPSIIWSLMTDKEREDLDNNCTLMDFKGSHLGKWKTHNCSDVLPFICKKVKGASSTIVIVAENDPTVPSVECPNDYLPYWKSCYKYFSTPMTWDSAEAECEKESAHLISIKNIYENAYARWVSRKNNYTSWIGLTNKKDNNSYAWSDGKPLLYNNWFPDSPYIPHKKPYCIKQTGIGWNISECSEMLPFLCKISNEVTPTPPSKIKGKCPAGDPDWIDAGENCFLIKAFEKKSNKLTWGKAYTECELSGFKIASFHNEEEYNYIKTIVDSLTNQYLWIGFYRSLNGNFSWIDQSEISFTAWDIKYPVNISLKEDNDCVMMTSDGKWRNSDCQFAAGFMCKYIKTGASESTVTRPSLEITTRTSSNYTSERLRSRNENTGLSTGSIFAICICVLIGLITLGVSFLAYQKRNKLPNFMQNPRGFLQTLCHSSDDDTTGLSENMENPK